MNADLRFKLDSMVFSLRGHLTPDTDGAVTRECLRRLVILGLPPKVILGFLRGNVWVNESPSGRLRRPTESDTEYVESIERTCDCRVYLIIRDNESEEHPIYYLSTDRSHLFWRSERKYLRDRSHLDGWGVCPAVQLPHSSTEEPQRCEIMTAKTGRGLKLVYLGDSPVASYDYFEEEDEE